MKTSGVFGKVLLSLYFWLFIIFLLAPLVVLVVFLIVPLTATLWEPSAADPFTR